MPTSRVLLAALLIAGLLGLLILAIRRFLQTPKEDRYRLSARDLPARQAADLASGLLVEIQPRPKQALLQSLPWALLFGPLAALALYLKVGKVTSTDTLFGINTLYLAFVALDYALPLALLVFALAKLPMALEVIRHGYFPPLDTATFRPVLARKGPASRARGYVLAALPLLALFTVAAGHRAHTHLFRGRSYGEIVRDLQRIDWAGK